ncbi:Helicase ARIP4 [Trichostrongylus colubriformis]|uniref:Helicase ARIP4 n=1 Tax=Trichostrongylus colubriformis TaxID=6319 RepID=A0AAN8ILK9_TRICO
MSAGGSLKLSISLNRGISSTTENNQFIRDEKMDESESKSRPNSANSEVAMSTSTENSSGKPSRLLNVKIPTATKSQKRKHIQTNFDNSSLLSQPALDAQRKEKERLERLERQKQSVGVNGHIQQVAAMLPKPVTPLPVLDAFDPEVICLIGDDSDPGLDSKKKVPTMNGSAAKAEPEVIELSSGDEDEKYDGRESSTFAPYRVVPPLPSSSDYGKRSRWMYSDKDRADHRKMEKQHKMEKERMKRRRNSHELEKIELTQTGRLLVNAGHGPDDPDVHVSPYLTHVLQPHQLGGVRFLYDNIVESLSEFETSPGFGCILAHSMGLGKTIQVITFIEVFLRVTKAKKVLVIVPINTIQNWYSEFEKWIPRYSETGEICRQFEVFLLGDAVKTFDQRVNLIENWMHKGGVLLIGYEMFRLLIRSTQPRKPMKTKPNSSIAPQIDVKPDDFDQGFTADGRVKKEANDIIRGALVDPGADLVVCDEGHKIKNLNTDIALALKAIRTKRRIVLTGYPLQNNLMEYYCMVDFVRPDFLGSRKTFTIQFEKPIKNGQCIDSTARDIKIARQRIHVLNSMLKGFIQRRTHHLLKAILPESKEFVLLLRKSPLQHALYRNFVMYANSEISSGNTSVFNPLKAFAACSKIWNHPDILAKTLERKREERRKSSQQKDGNEEADDRIPSYLEQAPNMANASPWQFQPHEGTSHFPSRGFSHAVTSRNPSMACTPIPGPSYSGASSNAWSSTYPPTTAQSGSSAVPSILEQTLRSNLSDHPRVTHNDLWNGVFSTEPPTPTSAFMDSKQGDELLRTSLKGKRSNRLRPRTIQGVMEDEFDITEIDQGLQYDWAEVAMASYKTGNIEHGYKMVLALELLDACVRIGEKMLIFSQNLTALDLIENYLSRRPLKTPTDTTSWMKSINYFRLDGGTPGSEREKLINRFNSDPSVYLFLISTRAGSLGINLVSANRVYRYGQQRRTYIYRLILNNCMEKAIFNRQISKHGLQQRVVDEAQVDANITQKELETLLMYDESLDVIHEKWDTTKWDFGDEVLESVVKNRSEMLAEQPFLHESLMLEREEGLSEEEKREAELWFTKEQYKEALTFPYNDTPMYDSGTHYGGYSRAPTGPPNWIGIPQFNPMTDPPPLRSTPIPHQLDRVPMPGSGEYPLGYGQPIEMYNGNVRGTLGVNRMINPMEGPRRVPPFPGASIAFEPASNSRGSVQLIRTDRALNLPVVSHPTERREIPANTQAMLVRSADGVFLRLGNGLLLNAQNSVFDSVHNRMPPVVTIPPEPPRPLRLPSPLNRVPDVIELD